MTAACPTDIAINPSNPAQWYILWGNGRIDNIGGCPATAISDGSIWFARTDQPVGVAIHITNWTTGAGYVLDIQGGVQQLNGAPALGLGSIGVDCTALGLPYVQARQYIHWSWDPAGSGRFVALDVYGQLYAVNGATGPSRTGPRWSWPAAKKVQMLWASGQPSKAITLDLYGGLHTDYSATYDNSGPYWPGVDIARDLVVYNWSATGGFPSGYVMDLYGGMETFGGAPLAWGGKWYQGSDVGRCAAVLNTSNPETLLQVFAGGSQWQWNVTSTPTVTAGAGVSEVQKVTITGTPTGGTFKLVFGGQTTGTIAYNATAATVQTALQALSSIGAGNATVTGGPGPGTAWTVTFAGALATTNVAQMTTSTVAFTGGTSPTVAVTTVTDGQNANPASTITTTTRPTLAWAYSDPASDAQAAWTGYVFTQTFASGHDMSNPATWASSALVAMSGTDPKQRGVVAGYDFPNGTYVWYIQAQNTAGTWSAWASRTWTQAVTPPVAPTGLTAVATASYGANLAVSATTGGSANTIAFGYSDDGGTTWSFVRGGDSVPLATTTTVTDLDCPLGGTRMYRAVAYNNNPRVISTYTSTASVTTPSPGYMLTAVGDSTLGGIIYPSDAPTWTRTAVAGVFAGVGAEYPIVVSDGVPKAQKIQLGLTVDQQSQWLMIKALLESNATLVYRTPFGEVTYCRVVGDVTRTQVKAAPEKTEPWSVRHLHKVVIPLVEITEPLVLDVGNTVPPSPTGATF